MGTHHGGDSGNRPQDGDHPPEDPRFVSGLPPEWGPIQIPDDPSELAEEADQIRDELAEREREREREQVARNHLADRRSRRDNSSVGVPLMIMSIAVMITLVSLFAMAWTGPGNPVDTAPEQPAEHLPDLTLSEASGQPVTLGSRLPVALLLVEECTDCTELIAATVAAAPPGVTVAAVGHQAPPEPPTAADAGTAPLLLADPEQRLRTALGLGSPVNAATVVLVNEQGEVVQRLPSATAIGQFQADLEQLGTA